MIIKSHTRGNYQEAANYLKHPGDNEKTRLVEISDPEARTLEEAFRNMIIVGSTRRLRKPLHHISINPMKDERLTDRQLLAVVHRCEKLYGYKLFHHQRVIVEHIKKERQHFHVMWNRISLYTGAPVNPGLHWKKSIRAAREMEQELGLRLVTTDHRKIVTPLTTVALPLSPSSESELKQPTSAHAPIPSQHETSSILYSVELKTVAPRQPRPRHYAALRMSASAATSSSRTKSTQDRATTHVLTSVVNRFNQETDALLAWAWRNGRRDILSQFGIEVPTDYFDI